MSRNIIDYIIITLKGVAMGAADVVPGVSGGTIAFVSGIYKELINSIKSFNWQNLMLLLKGDIKGFWKAVNANFLLSLFIGIGISILSLAKLFHFLLDNYPIFVWSFFFGLIISSAITPPLNKAPKVRLNVASLNLPVDFDTLRLTLTDDFPFTFANSETAWNVCVALQKTTLYMLFIMNYSLLLKNGVHNYIIKSSMQKI